MSVIWKYLDKRAAAIEAIKDYDSMKFIIDNTDDKIAKEENQMIGVSSPRWDGMPHAHNPNAGEERIVTSIEEIDVLKERYRQALEYMAWFQPAWNELNDDEQYVLEMFYRDGSGYGENAAEALAGKYNIERSSVYRKKNRALDHLTMLLFGKG